MVLAAIIPTAAGAVWHGQRGFAAFNGVAASKKSSRLAGKYLAGQDDGAVGRETPAVAAPNGAQQSSLNGLAPTLASATTKRGKGALDKGKRKREDIGAAERPPLMLSEQKTPKDKKDHDKYCHFCQVFFFGIRVLFLRSLFHYFDHAFPFPHPAVATWRPLGLVRGQQDLDFFASEPSLREMQTLAS